MSEQKDTGMILKIGHLYPTLMSVAADRGNLFSIQKRCQWRGIATEVEQIYVRQTPDFTKYDLILFHGGADREMELASRDIQAKVLVGWGNNGKDGFEAARYRYVFGTYLHGPVLPKNPWFTDYLIQLALERRYGKVELAPLDDTIENAAHDAALQLAMEFKGTLSAIEATPWKR